jgi:hypothetical protein
VEAGSEPAHARGHFLVFGRKEGFPQRPRDIRATFPPPRLSSCQTAVLLGTPPLPPLLRSDLAFFPIGPRFVSPEVSTSRCLSLTSARFSCVVAKVKVLCCFLHHL